MASEGPNNPIATSSAGGGDTNWNDPQNVYSSNDSYMTADGGFFGASTDVQQFTGFGFAVPGGATIAGIVLEIERKATGGVIDGGIRLLKAGVAAGDNKGTGSAWPGSDAYATYGGAADLWGTTWTESQVNATDFGMSISANIDPFETAFVDHIRLTVYYTTGGSPVTAALTGISSTSARGTLSLTASPTLTGGSSTSARGTLTPTVSPALTGSYVTAYGPTTIPCPAGQARQYDVGPFTGGTGDYATLTGTVRVSRDTAYDVDNDVEVRVGYSGVIADWTVVLWYVSAPDGTARFLTTFCESPAPANRTYTQDAAVTDCCSTYTTFDEGGAGTGTPPDPPDVAPVGLCTGCGDLFPSAAVSQTGLSSTASLGTTTHALAYTLTGQAITTAVGTLTYTLDANLTGLSTTANTGTPTPSADTSLTGNNVTGAAGTPSPGVTYTLTGQGVTSAAGSVTYSLTAALTGVAATTAAGALTADLTTALTGNGDTTTFTGTLSPALVAALTGLAASPAQGEVDPQESYGAALTGQSVTVSLGTLGVSITAGLTGQSLAVSQGSLTATVRYPFGELYGKWQYPRPKTGRWQYTSPKVGTWAYPDELAGRWDTTA